MYYSAWLTLVVISLWISLAAFVWALKSGQFSDQNRARYLALADEPPPPGKAELERRRKEPYALIGVGALGFTALVALVLMSFLRL